MNISERYYNEVKTNQADLLFKMNQYILTLFGLSNDVFFIDSIRPNLISISKKDNCNFKIIIFLRPNNSFVRFAVDVFSDNPDEIKKMKSSIQNEINNFTFFFSDYYDDNPFEAFNVESFDFNLFYFDNDYYHLEEEYKKEFNFSHIGRYSKDLKLTIYSTVPDYLKYSLYKSVDYLIHKSYFKVQFDIDLKFKDYSTLKEYKQSVVSLDFDEFESISLNINQNIYIEFNDDGLFNKNTNNLLDMSFKI